MLNRNFIDELNGNIDVFQYKYSNDYQEERASFEEAYRWMQLGLLLEKENIYDRTPYIALVYACEIFVKSLLLNEGKSFSNGHYLSKLIEKLNSNIKRKLIERFKVNKLSVLNDKDDCVKVLENFEDYLIYISNYFADLKYEYENIKKEQIITIPRIFINDIVFELYNIFCEVYSQHLQ